MATYLFVAEFSAGVDLKERCDANTGTKKRRHGLSLSSFPGRLSEDVSACPSVEALAGRWSEHTGSRSVRPFGVASPLLIRFTIATSPQLRDIERVIMNSTIRLVCVAVSSVLFVTSESNAVFLTDSTPTTGETGDFSDGSNDYYGVVDATGTMIAGTTFNASWGTTPINAIVTPSTPSATPLRLGMWTI